jgi:phage terminase small subunit
MSSIKVKDASVSLTEQTLRELLKAVEAAKEIGREEVMVESPWSEISFLIHTEIKEHTQESEGYNRVSVKHGNKKEEPKVDKVESEPAYPEWIDIKMATRSEE